MHVITTVEPQAVPATDVADARRTWVGNANWTPAVRRKHVEFGLWSNDPDLLAANTRFLCDVIRVSEPSSSLSLSQTTDLVDAPWDDDGFADYAAGFLE